MCTVSNSKTGGDNGNGNGNGNGNDNDNDNEKTGCDSKNDEETRRFEVELEFVQCLASPSYLNFLAQNEYFDSPDFIAYLNYLQYWRIPQYARFVVYPHALYFLQLLQDRSFREAIKSADYSLMVHQQQGFMWQHLKKIKSEFNANNANANA